MRPRPRKSRPAAKPSSASGGYAPAPSPPPLPPPPAEPMAKRANNERDRTPARRVQAPDQNADRATIGRYGGDVVLGAARLRSDQHAQGRRLADACNKADRSAN